MIVGLSAGPDIGLSRSPPCTGGFAKYVFELGLLIGLVGALGSSALQFVFPALIHMKLFRHTTSKAHLVLDGFYILLGIAGGVLGTIQIIIKIIDVYRNEI